MSEWGQRFVVTLAIAIGAHGLQHVTAPWMQASAFSTDVAAGGWLIVAHELYMTAHDARPRASHA